MFLEYRKIKKFIFFKKKKKNQFKNKIKDNILFLNFFLYSIIFGNF
jgi:hypothetical protein